MREVFHCEGSGMIHLGTKTIETPRLILRQFRLSDAAYMYENWASDPMVTRYLTWPPHESVEISCKIIASWMAEYEKNRTYQWCIECKAVSEAIGSISAIRLNEAIGAVEIGYCIGRAYWNCGITSEALSAVIDFFFNEVGANRVEARHDSHNPNSGKVMQKCGMLYEGMRKMADKNNRGICDIALYGAINPMKNTR